MRVHGEKEAEACMCVCVCESGWLVFLSSVLAQEAETIRRVLAAEEALANSMRWRKPQTVSRIPSLAALSTSAEIADPKVGSAQSAWSGALRSGSGDKSHGSDQVEK